MTALAAQSNSVPNPRYRGLKPYQPGQSGNPSGKPKRLAELQALSQVNFPVAVERLAKLIQSQDEELAFRVIQFVFLYVLGKPAEATSLAHLESMRARLTELVVQPLPEVAPDAPPPNSVPELVQEPLTTSPVPPEAAGVVTASVLREEPVTPPPSEPSGFVMTPERQAFLETIRPPEVKPQGLRCLFRGKDGQCSELAQDGKQWCPGHLAKLFEVTR